jgi:acetylornithine deacetylase/succinyl-diaminopimelate desuccinylase-like protein
MVPTSAVQPPSDELEETAVIARDLIRIDTTNYGEGKAKGEREAAEYVEAKLAALGLEPHLFEPAARRTSVVARVPGRLPTRATGASTHSRGRSATACCGGAVPWT